MMIKAAAAVSACLSIFVPTEVFALDRIGEPPRPSLELRPSFSPDGRFIVFTSNRAGNWDIYTIEVSTGKLRQITYLSDHQFAGRFSPDGKRILFYTNHWNNPWTGSIDHDVYMVGWDGSDMHPVVNDPSQDMFGDWTGDGRSVVFVSDRDGEKDRLYSIDLETKKVTPLTATWPTNLFQPKVHWPSSDVFFDAPAPDYEGDGDARELWRLKSGSGEIIRLTNNDVADYGAMLSSNGKKIVFQTEDSAGRSQIGVMDADGRHSVILTDQGENMTPAWSPDDSRIVFIRKTMEPIDPHVQIRNHDIYIMDADGRNVRQILSW